MSEQGMSERIYRVGEEFERLISVARDVAESEYAMYEDPRTAWDGADR